MESTHEEYMKYQQKLLKYIDGNRTRLINNIRVDCACGTTCLLSSYFNHCNSRKHELYLTTNHKNYIYDIIDSNFDINI